MSTKSTKVAAYKATPKLERELARAGRASLEGARCRASVASTGPSYYEAWTDNLPFVYGKPATTLQGALDNLEAAVRDLSASSAVAVSAATQE